MVNRSDCAWPLSRRGLKPFADDLPRITGTGMKLISQPVDFLAYNRYSGFPFEVTAGGGENRFCLVHVDCATPFPQNSLEKA